MGPAVSALVTVAIHYAFRALSLMNRELIETRSQLAESERESGMIAERQRIAHEIHDTRPRPVLHPNAAARSGSRSRHRRRAARQRAYRTCTPHRSR